MLDVDDIVAIAEHEWRTMRIVDRDRATLSHDLRLELTAAVADGAPPQQLLGDDIRAFARELADAAAARRLPYETTRILRTALVGAAPGLLYGWVSIWRLPYVGESLPTVIALRYLLPVVLVVAGALIAVHRHLADVVAINRTVRAMALLVPAAGVLAVPVTMGFAALTDYSTALPVLMVEVGIVAAVLSGATWLARRWALQPAIRATRRPAVPL